MAFAVYWKVLCKPYLIAKKVKTETYGWSFVAHSFFSVMGCYGPGGDSISASLAFKKLVKELHRNGIEVFASSGLTPSDHELTCIRSFKEGKA